jgi:zinc protease
MLDEGTESRSSLEIGEELDRLGANLRSGAGLDSATVSLSVLKENLGPSLDVFADVVLNPSFPEADFARLKRQRLATIQQEKARPMSIALRLLPGLIFGKDHAYGAPLTGSGDEASTEKMSRDDLRSFHKTWFQPQNATLTIVGDTSVKEIVPMLESKLGGWKKTGEVPTKNITRVDDPEKRVVYLVDKPHAQQSVIIAGLPALPKDNPDEIAIETMNAILGGTFTSRINMNLREDKHWAYGARSMVFDAKGQRLFLAYAPVQTDKTKESIQEMDKELRWILGDKPATAEELTKAKDNQTLRLPGRFETKRALQGALREMVVYGRPADYYETYPDKVRALDLDQIQKAAAKVVKPDRLIWIVVGDLTEIAKGVDELGFGEVRRMSPDGELLN